MINQNSEEARIERSLDHLWHVWINKRQEKLKEENKDHRFEHSLYEFKNMFQFLTYGDEVIKKSFEGKLSQVHQQCSHQFPVPILNNVLKCAIGERVDTCPILLHLKEVFEFSAKEYEHVPPEAVYKIMSKTCAWHIYTTKTRATDDWGGIDTSEGYMQDTSDRMFWENVYKSLSDNGGS